MRVQCSHRPIGAALCMLSIVLVTSGCTSPTRPTLSLAASRPIAPASGAQISFFSQPIVISVAKGAATGGAATVTTIELSTDAAFSTIVDVEPTTPDGSSQLTVAVTHLNPSTTYYWRAKTAADATTVLSPTASFTIGPLSIPAPLPLQPLSGSFAQKRPTLTVANANRTGTPIALTYAFEIASDATFNRVVASGSVPEGVGQTSFRPSIDLTSGAAFYWRARAVSSLPAVVSADTAPQTSRSSISRRAVRIT